MNQAAFNNPTHIDTSAAHTTEPSSNAGMGRWYMAVAAGMVLSSFFGILLSYVAFLMMLLGLFFYMLFGLIVGATVYRIGSAAQPISRLHLMVSLMLIVLSSWGVSLMWESHSFPDTVSRLVIEKTAQLPDGVSKIQLQEQTRQAARDILIERYPPGGMYGYFMWIFKSGTFERNTLPNVNFAFSLSQNGWTWLIRVVLSFALTVFGVGSQIMAIAHKPKPTDEIEVS